EEALALAAAEAGTNTQPDALAVTVRPGLVGSLMMGGQFAKTLSIVNGIPLIGVNHLEAHFYALCLESGPHEYPFLGLLLSGGNSIVYRVDGPGRLEALADTLDDACGEAFDKVAVLLGLAYPGGPVVEKTAATFTPASGHKSLFPRLLRGLDRAHPVFSFSGIKTAVLRTDRSPDKVPQICFDFQETVFELVERVLSIVVEETGIQRVVCAGGVLANGVLKRKLTALGEARGWHMKIPEKKILCTDNAAMVASLGYFLAESGLGRIGLDFHVSSTAEPLGASGRA
ncbi:MAG: tRNA (adenosine(37)-N6)-threonylcarbamoyltransferase complex transferase subunit TsaD, partial [Spirochaetia bacterium]|nr:tRNA (adenosine(37)-N6)-threonylcarbamoyltransferase complex transferase subunit TsaD [Spirochaetia bacterium]